MALTKACIVGNSVKNTGKECDIAMGPTAMIIAVPASTVLTEDDLLDIVAWARPLMHADKQSRIYPLFGSIAPINVITNDAESDVEVTLDDGTKVPVRLGVYSRTFETIAGGLCYASALLSFIGSGYRIIEIDQAGKTLVRRNDTLPKTWGGIITSYMGGKSPTLATLKDVFRNRFGYSFTPQEMVNNGEIFEGGGPLLGLMGLIDSEITNEGAATFTTPAVGATRTQTLTGVGADNDTYNAGYGSGAVIKTAAESNVTLLAVKVKNAINAATGTNGGYTATNLAGVITITAPSSLGASLNTIDAAPVIVGTITGTHTAFTGGVTGVGVLRIGVQTHCAESDLVDLIGADLADVDNFIVSDNADSSVITMASASIVSGHIEMVGPIISGHTYNVIGSAPSVWYGNEILGYDASENGIDILIP